jgi:hypothetical protein
LSGVNYYWLKKIVHLFMSKFDLGNFLEALTKGMKAMTSLLGIDVE